MRHISRALYPPTSPVVVLEIGEHPLFPSPKSAFLARRGHGRHGGKTSWSRGRIELIYLLKGTQESSRCVVPGAIFARSLCRRTNKCPQLLRMIEFRLYYTLRCL